jgi:N-acetylmuramoyl-L-alanine amidase
MTRSGWYEVIATTRDGKQRRVNPFWTRQGRVGWKRAFGLRTLVRADPRFTHAIIRPYGWIDQRTTVIRQPRLVTRTQWGARDAKQAYTTTSWDARTPVVVHWPGIGNTRIPRTDAAERAQLRRWQDSHMDANGWNDIGYHYAISQRGIVYQCRPVETVGAHAGSNLGNRRPGILFMVGNDEAPSQQAVDAFNRLRTRVLGNYGPIHGHNQYSPTQCPGPRIIPALNRGTP